MPLVWQVDRSHRLPKVTGQVRWNGNTKCFEVDSTSNHVNHSSIWHSIDNTVELQSNDEWEEIFHWAKQKMAEEKRIKELAEKYPALKSAKNNLDMVLALVQDVK